MKFTPETLIQIYLDGSFTEEAQAEFDALMRKDPAFAERVTQALAERLGPVPESTVESLSTRLDGKIGDLWKAHRPSPWGAVLGLGLKGVVAVAVVAGLFFGMRPFLTHLGLSPSPAHWFSTPQNLSHPSAVRGDGQILKLNATSGKTGAGASTLQVSASSMGTSSKGATGEGNSSIANIPSIQTGGANGSQNSEATDGSSNHSPTMGSATASILVGPAAQAPALAENPPPTGTTAEGNSLRVAIDTDETQNVTVTVYDSNGLLIRHLYAGVLESGEHDVDWDGKDEFGNVVLPGDYTVILDMGGKKMSGILKVLPGR